ncbi:MAG: putative Zn-dependent protease [Paracoccaceae bacterium]
MPGFAIKCLTQMKQISGRVAFAGLIGITLFAQASAGFAQGLIRDAEIENTLAKIARPLFKSSGVGRNQIEILVVNDSSLNAFVVNGRAIFLHSGLITRLETVEMLQTVIGHELAHITSGHLVRRSLNQQSAQTAIGLGLLLGIAAAASGNSELAGGLAAGTTGSTIRNFLSHSRAEETSADQVSVRYLVRAGIDPAAALDVMEIFRGQEALSIGRQDPYTRSHPLSQDRIRALKGQIAAYSGRSVATSADLKYWHARMQAKFSGFTGNPSYILRKLNKNDRSEPAVMTRAIAYHRQGKLRLAMKQMSILLNKRPQDPYYRELEGQILLEGDDAKSAVRAYKKAVALAPKEPLILAGYGRALLALKTKSGDIQALKTLRRARQMDPRDARMLRDLAVAWAKFGNNGMASLVTAERYALLSRFKDAQTNANRAAGLLPRGTISWLRAQDILAASKVALKK